MTILAQTPTAVRQLNSPVGALQPVEDMTLAELQALRASWLRQARESGDIDSLILIIRTLGKPGDVKGWPLWQMYELKRGGVVARLYEGTGDYLPGSRDYNRIQTLAVYASGYQVCYIRQSDA